MLTATCPNCDGHKYVTDLGVFRPRNFLCNRCLGSGEVEGEYRVRLDILVRRRDYRSMREFCQNLEASNCGFLTVELKGWSKRIFVVTGPEHDMAGFAELYRDSIVLTRRFLCPVPEYEERAIPLWSVPWLEGSVK